MWQFLTGTMTTHSPSSQAARWGSFHPDHGCPTPSRSPFHPCIRDASGCLWSRHKRHRRAPASWSAVHGVGYWAQWVHLVERALAASAHRHSRGTSMPWGSQDLKVNEHAVSTEEQAIPHVQLVRVISFLNGKPIHWLHFYPGKCRDNCWRNTKKCGTNTKQAGKRSLTAFHRG